MLFAASSLGDCRNPQQLFGASYSGNALSSMWKSLVSGLEKKVSSQAAVGGRSRDGDGTRSPLEWTHDSDELRALCDVLQCRAVVDVVSASSDSSSSKLATYGVFCLCFLVLAPSPF